MCFRALSGFTQIRRVHLVKCSALMAAAHDSTFRRLLKTKGVARTFVIERLPRWFAKRVVGDPEILSESYVDERHRRVFADVVLRVRLRGGGSLILYCLLEHKRVEERFALVQLLQYMTAIYEQQARSGVRKLAPVVPIIVYNGKDRFVFASYSSEKSAMRSIRTFWISK